VEKISPTSGTMVAGKWPKKLYEKAKKGIHDARKVAEAAEKSAEPEGQIGID
jgi:hypothetical protein